MAASGKFDMSSGSPDRPIHTPRGSYTGALLNRSGSFRENVETPIISSLPSLSRSSGSVSQGDVTNFLHSLHFDPKSIAADYKLSRQVEFKKLTSIALGLQVDDSAPKKPLPSPFPEDLKQLKAGLIESSNNARERQKIFNETISVMNKCFPGIPSRKRSRLDAVSSERANASFSSERPVLGSNMSKAGSQNHAIASGFELEQQKSEERVKIAIPNKRTRTSLVDVRPDSRAGTPARSSGSMDREVLRLPSTGAVNSEERSSLVGVDSWEKAKMKKKRSGIKAEVSPSSGSTKHSSGGAKQQMQSKLSADARPKNDSHGFRPGFSSVAAGVGKTDVTVQPTSAGMRSSIPKAEQDNSSHLHDKRDRPASVDKEMVNLRTVNKKSAREDFSSPSPTSNIKMNSAARGPRSGSNSINKLSHVVQRTSVVDDCEPSHSTSKNSGAVGATNRKRTPSAQPSSPPVTQWASQRPQKNSRTARRTNFVPIIASNDESLVLDAISDGTGNETGSVTARRLSTNSPRRVKSKGGNFSSPAVSDSEESGATETKVREKIKIKKNIEVDEKASLNCQKVSALPPRKNKLVNGDDHGNGVRKKGRRTGRGFTSTRSLIPMTVEKHGSMGTAKQLRSARLGFEKTESKVGRPSARNLPDRKPCARQKQTTISATADFHDDGHEELLAAATAVSDPAFCFSSTFWRHMESYYSFFLDSDLAYLKQQENTVLTTLATVSPNLNSCSTFPNGDGLLEAGRDMNYVKSPDILSPQLAPTAFETPLYQRVMTALISEEECEEFYNRNDGLEFDVHETGPELDKLQFSSLNNHQLSGNFQLAGCTGLNGYKIAANGSINDMEHAFLDGDIISEKGMVSDFKYLQNGLLSDQTVEAGIGISEFQYSNMSIDERILLELKSVGLSPEPVPDLLQTGDEEAIEEIEGLKDKYMGQVSTAKEAMLGKLFNSASEKIRFQEKEFEDRALDKLMAMAYEKYMARWGPNLSGGKNTSSKMAKQAALDFLKRTLERGQRFEETSKSCFSETVFRDIFISGAVGLRDELLVDGKSVNDFKNGDSPNDRDTVAIGTQQSPDVNNQVIYCPNPTLSGNHPSQQFINKDDPCSNKIKKREVSLYDVGVGGSISSTTKGKRSDRDKEGTVNREASRNGGPKSGQTTSSNIRGERKPKQKNTQVSASVNGLVNKLPEQPKATLHVHPGTSGITNSEIVKGDDEFLEDPIDLSHLQLPGFDDFGGPDDPDGQGQDIGSWFDIDDELPDHDGFDGLNGLEIPMDDLSELNMKF